jgi:hypothetical protein
MGNLMFDRQFKSIICSAFSDPGRQPRSHRNLDIVADTLVSGQSSRIRWARVLRSGDDHLPHPRAVTDLGSQRQSAKLSLHARQGIAHSINNATLTWQWQHDVE